MTTKNAFVVGAGIAGLAAAAGLANTGWTVRVFERSAELRASGGGIGLTPNGVKALNALGAGDAVRAISVPQTEGGVRTPDGRWIARTELDFIEARYGESIRALRRIELVRALEEALVPGSVRFGEPVVPAAHGDATSPAAILVGGKRYECDLLVAADGIGSAARRSAFPAHPGVRATGSVSWRAVVPADGLAVTAAETWGAGKRFSVLPLPGGEVHFSAMARSALLPDGDGSAEELLKVFGDWHDPVPELLARAVDGGFFFDEIEELAEPLPSFARGRTVLIGDAGHPMTPNVGSANLALEDAAELAYALRGKDSWAGLSAGLARYDALRRPRTDRLARLSRRMGRVAGVRSPLAVAMRDTGARLGGLMPDAFSRRFMDSMVRWAPSGPVPLSPR
ncbi:FAD-dependent monooxygenase [Amycolatopsis sp. cg5]|uniref:FAD-dependent monooxygenase n=1 Tax=Amycolatopsis sp. cg5 TaxID=3238802 RepID=UPI0035260226